MEQRASIEMTETNTNFHIKKNKIKVQKKAAIGDVETKACFMQFQQA